MDESQFEPWPSGDTKVVATLSIHIDDLMRIAPAASEEFRDELGPALVLHVRLDSGRRVLLEWRDEAPPPATTTLWCDAGDDPEEARRETLAHFGLNHGHISWTPDDPTIPDSHEVIFGSDVERDGVFLELGFRDNTGYRAIAEVFRSDRNGVWTLWAEQDTPLPWVEELVERARARLPTDGLPRP